MYNDYYLEQINNKLTTTNNRLQEVEQLQEETLQQISGDMYTNNKTLENIININGCLLFVTSIILLYLFIKRCLQ